MAANNLVNTKQDLIAALVQRELREAASLLPLVTDYSSLAVKGAKQIEIPRMSSFTVQSRAFGAAATENAALSDSTDVIALDNNKIVFFGFDSHDEFQSTTNYLTTAISRASSAHGRDINSALVTEWTAVAGLSVLGDAPAAISASNILDMREFMMDNFADMSRVRFAIAPDQEKAMLALPEFSRYDYRGVGPAPILNGVIGSVYGVPVIVNTQIGAGQAFMIEEGGCGFAFQRAPAVGQDTDLRYGTGGMQVAVDTLWGLGGLQLGQGNAGAGLSPLIAKLID